MTSAPTPEPGPGASALPVQGVPGVGGPAEQSDRPRVVLIGVPGAGVSTVAELVGNRRGLTVLDTDQVVERELGAPIEDLLVQHGEEKFRAAETRVATGALQRDCVVALGSGTRGVAERLAELAAGGVPIVHLTVTPGVAMRRLGLSGLGAVAPMNPRALWVTMAAERAKAFDVVATHAIDTTTKEPDDVADEVVLFLS
ncbi:Shikimate kinase I |nr:Shikimate kinase I \